MSPRPEISESLFDLVAPESKLHVSFRDLARAQRFGAARSEMDRVFSKWGDCDSQFRRDFQTAGFDARVWELYLRAVLSDVELVAANSYSRPDFRCLYDGCEFFIEATTANESGNRAAPNSVSEYLDRLRDSTDDRDQLAIKFAGPLRSKLNRDYHLLDHVKGKPFTIAIQGFFDGALFCNVLPLVRYLLGVSLVDFDDRGQSFLTERRLTEHRGSNKAIGSGWFHTEETESVSAVIWSNSGTVHKFGRMAHLAGSGPQGWAMHRIVEEEDPKRGARRPVVQIERVGTVDEPWSEGLVVIHNPNATSPLPTEAFSAATQIRLTQEGVGFDLVGRRIFNQSSASHKEADSDAVIASIERTYCQPKGQ